RAKPLDAGAVGAAQTPGHRANTSRSASVRWAERVTPINGLYRSSHGRLLTQTDKMPTNPTAARHDGRGACGIGRAAEAERAPNHPATTGAAARNHQTVIRIDMQAGTT